jgi:uncharacterized protein (TIGR00255 family)
MTGYGRAETRDGGWAISVEIRSVNHRFGEISVRLPRAMAMLESRVRDRTLEVLSRGKVTISVSVEGGEEGEIANLKVDEPVARRYAAVLADLKDKLGLAGDLDLATFVALPDILKWERDEVDEETAWQMLSPTLDRALADLVLMKRREGELLALDLIERLNVIQASIDRIVTRVPLMIDAVRHRLTERLQELLKDQETEFQRYRVDTEIVLFADRTDSTEECVRLRAHCQQFLELIQSPQPAGRKLNFLLQEMNREANTIGSKSLDVEIAREVITIKEEAERLREQAANIE